MDIFLSDLKVVEWVCVRILSGETQEKDRDRDKEW